MKARDTMPWIDAIVRVVRASRKNADAVPRPPARPLDTRWGDAIDDLKSELRGPSAAWQAAHQNTPPASDLDAKRRERIERAIVTTQPVGSNADGYVEPDLEATFCPDCNLWLRTESWRSREWHCPGCGGHFPHLVLPTMIWPEPKVDPRDPEHFPGCGTRPEFVDALSPEYLEMRALEEADRWTVKCEPLEVTGRPVATEKWTREEDGVHITPEDLAARLIFDQRVYGFSAVERRYEIDDAGAETETVTYSGPLQMRPSLYGGERTVTEAACKFFEQATDPDLRRQKLADKVEETYCNQCDTWSPESRWEEGWTDGLDESDGEGYVACPNCGHHHPPHDPRTRVSMPSGSKIEILPGSVEARGGPHPPPAYMDEVELHVDQHEQPIAKATEWTTLSRRYTPLQPALTQTRSSGGEPGTGIIPRHREMLEHAVGGPAEFEQYWVGHWVLEILLPGREPIKVRAWPDLHYSAWGGAYDLRALAQIGMRREAVERGGYC